MPHLYGRIYEYTSLGSSHMRATELGFQRDGRVTQTHGRVWARSWVVMSAPTAKCAICSDNLSRR